jgi:hypothetical protein
MEIRVNSMLKPTTKIIKPYDCSFIVQEGPNIISKFPFGDLAIPYESHFFGKMTLEPGGVDRPIMYGFLGNQVTFLAIKPYYNSDTTYSSCKAFSQTDGYIEYYFEDEPFIRRAFTNLLILTGNEEHKIPQVYLYNPTNKTVILDILCANIGPNLVNSALEQTKTTFSGLYYTSILSDQTEYFVGSTGSTQFQVYDAENNLILSIPYAKIEVLEIENEKIQLQTDSDDYIDLVFLSEFNAKQAHSRMSWATENYAYRFLTPDYPPVDYTPPIINFYSNPISSFTGTTLTKDEIREYFIYNVIDDRDGEISKYDVDVNIVKKGSIRQFETITENGVYDITFRASDIAGNLISDVKTLSVYRSAPSIIFKSSANNNTMYINDSYYYKPQGFNFINSTDILTYYIRKQCCTSASLN